LGRGLATAFGWNPGYGASRLLRPLCRVGRQHDACPGQPMRIKNLLSPRRKKRHALVRFDCDIWPHHFAHTMKKAASLAGIHRFLSDYRPSFRKPEVASVLSSQEGRGRWPPSLLEQRTQLGLESLRNSNSGTAGRLLSAAFSPTRKSARRASPEELDFPAADSPPVSRESAAN
jgi:hypothetical protein